MSIPDFDSLANHFLLAMPALQDSIFTSSLTFVFEHSEQGAAGLVVNKPIGMTVEEVFVQLDLPADGRKAADDVLAGGPVSPHQGFVLHRDNDWDETFQVGDVCISTSLDILRSLAADQGPDEALIVLGYAGWAPGQLEEELARNAWLTMEADAAVMFDTPLEKRTELAAKNLGFDLSMLGVDAGHA